MILLVFCFIIFTFSPLIFNLTISHWMLCLLLILLHGIKRLLSNPIFYLFNTTLSGNMFKACRLMFLKNVRWWPWRLLVWRRQRILLRPNHAPQLLLRPNHAPRLLLWLQLLLHVLPLQWRLKFAGNVATLRLGQLLGLIQRQSVEMGRCMFNIHQLVCILLLLSKSARKRLKQWNTK